MKNMKNAWNKRTHEEFIEDFKKYDISNKVDIVSQYTSCVDDILVKCRKCGKVWSTKPEYLRVAVYGCSDCDRRKAWNRKTHEQFMTEFYDTKNSDNFEVVSNYVDTHSKIKIKCKRCGYILNVTPHELRIRTYKCPNCDRNSIRINKSKNTKYIYKYRPDLVDLLKNKEDAQRYGIGSKMHVDWVCERCNKISSHPIYKVAEYGVKCPYCSDGVSMPNKIFRWLFDIKNIEYISEKTFDWGKLDNKVFRYDFYLPKFKFIIEANGEQHYKGSFCGRKLEEQQKTDSIKEELALKNGILKYYQVDCSKSEKEFIKNSIINLDLLSELNIFISDEEWNLIFKEAAGSLFMKIIDYYNKTNDSTKTIGKIFHLHKKNVIEYLKRGTSIGLCNYNPQEELLKSKFPKKKIKMYDLNNKFIMEFDSIYNACKYINKDINAVSNICYCLKNKTKHAYNYIWRYSEEGG